MTQWRKFNFAYTLFLAATLFTQSAATDCCESGDTKPNEDDCSQYYVCCTGQFVLKSCPRGEYWNLKDKECQKDNGECNGNGTCIEGDVKSDPDNCANYLLCANGKYESVPCPTGDYWNSKTSRCECDNGECNGNNQTCTDGETKVDSTDCTKYQLCSNGKFESVSCNTGDYWNAAAGKCEVDNGQCKGNQTCTDGELKANSADCAGYLQCVDNKFVEKKCAADSYFDTTVMACVIDEEGVCIPKNCTDGETKVDSTDCTKYQLCSNGKFESVSCNTGDYWNAAAGKCEVDNGQCKGNQTCTDGELKANSADCAGYLQCVDNKFVEKKCAADSYFDTTVMACVIDEEGVCIPKNCTDGETKEDSTDCTKYQLCSNGKFESVSCNSGDYWNAAAGKCEVDNGQCKGNQTCTDGELKVNPTDCAGYLQCVDNKFVEKKCAADSYFNSTILACVIDEEGVCIPKNCTDGETKEDSTDCTKYQLCSNGKFESVSCSSGDYWNAAASKCEVDNGQCKGNQTCTDGELKANSADCAGYLQCVDNKFVEKKCAADSYFDTTVMACVIDEEGVCIPKNCTDGETKEDSTDCTKYQLCSNGKFESVSCDTGDYWNAAASKCEVDNGQCKGNQTCTDGELKANSADCAGYLQCVNNKFVERKCAADTYFDTTVMACVIDEEGVCIPKVCDPECCDVPNNWLGPVDNNCSAFIQCLYGNKFQQRCPNNLQFNNDTKECDYPENVQCDDGSAPPSGPTAGPSGTYCESKGQCVGKPDGTMLAVLTDTCSGNYIVCQCECEINFKCSDGLVFNEQVRSCDWPANVNC